MNDEIPEGYVRVTEVLKPYTPFENLDPNSNFACNVKAAADRGKRVHEFCEAYALGLFVEECDSDCKNYFDAFKVWFHEMVEDVIHTEQRINSEKYRLSGQVDMVCLIKGDAKPSLVDIKTPLNSSKTWQLQTAAYALLLEQENIKVHRRICLMLPKVKGKASLVEYRDHKTDKNTFLDCLKVYRFFNI